ncbi:hypothetical protein A2U01_0109833, partial [Trifolium medium]|nr:hypothetical protein [Trifolium medium]
QSWPYSSPHFGPKCGRTNFEEQDPWRGQQGGQSGKIGLGVKVVLEVVPLSSSS